MILHLENPQNYKKAARNNRTVNKVAGCKTNAQKFMAFLYANNITKEGNLKKLCLMCLKKSSTWDSA